MSKLKFEMRELRRARARWRKSQGAIRRRCSREGQAGGDLKAANRTYEKLALSVVCSFKIGLEAKRLLTQTMNN
jgi:hypothetical protein